MSETDKQISGNSSQRISPIAIAFCTHVPSIFVPNLYTAVSDGHTYIHAHCIHARVEEIGVETSEVAILSETQYMKDFLNSIDVDCSLKSTYFSCLEEVLQSEVACVRDDYVFATSESYPAIGHVSEVENPPLRFSDIKHLKLKELWHNATMTEFNGLVDLRAFAFGVKVPRGSNVVSAR